MVFILVALILFFLSLLLTYLIRQFSVRKNILDIPNQRSLHQHPTPRGGGLAFVFTFYFTLILLLLNHFIQPNIFLSLLGGVPIAIAGYWDDIFGMKALWRACVHALSAAWGIYFLGGIPTLFFIAMVFITVWFVNLYNFMDGVDGLAGMEAVVVSGSAGLVLLLNDFNGISYVCFTITFSVFGFLILNWPSAKIFMGDVGSGFLGYIFAMLMWITGSLHQLPFPFWWILLGIFIADTGYTLLYRMIQKKKWWLAHREHAYQRITQSGFSHKKVTLGMLFLNLLICVPLAYIYLNLHQVTISIFYLILITTVFWAAWIYITKNYKAI